MDLSSRWGQHNSSSIEGGIFGTTPIVEPRRHTRGSPQERAHTVRSALFNGPWAAEAAARGSSTPAAGQRRRRVEVAGLSRVASEGSTDTSLPRTPVQNPSARAVRHPQNTPHVTDSSLEGGLFGACASSHMRRHESREQAKTLTSPKFPRPVFHSRS